MVTLPRPIWWLPYHVTRHGISTDCAFHAEILTDRQDPNTRFHRRLVIPVWNDIETIVQIPRTDILALYTVVGQTDWSIARQRADYLGVPLLIYHNSHEPFPITRVQEFQLRRGWDWVSPMLYAHPGETPEMFALRARDLVWWACQVQTPVVLTVQMYDRDGQETDYTKLSQIQSVWAQLVADYPSVIGIAPFAMRRAGGIIDFPWLRDWYDAYAAAAIAPTRPTDSTPTPDLGRGEPSAPSVVNIPVDIHR